MKTLMKLMLASLCALSATACAARPLVDLSVVDRDTGATLQTYAYHGRSYVPGEPGHRYELHLCNHTGERVMVVLSVDGVNAVTGQTAGADQNGYVLGPWENADIAGWRKSDDDIAQFVFTALEDSYAARTGRPDNVGVIGMAVFRERRVEPVYVPPPPIYAPPVAAGRKDENGPYDRREADRAAQPAAAPPASTVAQAAGSGYAAAKSIGSLSEAPRDSIAQQIGTGHGEREYSPIEQTTFERASSWPQQVTQIWYDTPQQLVARGIMPRWYAPRRPREDVQQAFPIGYVPDPPSRW